MIVLTLFSKHSTSWTEILSQVNHFFQADHTFSTDNRWFIDKPASDKISSIWIDENISFFHLLALQEKMCENVRLVTLRVQKTSGSLSFSRQIQLEFSHHVDSRMLKRLSVTRRLKQVCVYSLIHFWWFFCPNDFFRLTSFETLADSRTFFLPFLRILFFLIFLIHMYSPCLTQPTFCPLYISCTLFTLLHPNEFF